MRSLTVGIFHELRRPLQVLQSQLEILQLHSDRGKFEVKHVQEGLTGLERLKVMIEKVENLHRSERLRMMACAGEDKMVDLRPEEPK